MTRSAWDALSKRGGHARHDKARLDEKASVIQVYLDELLPILERIEEKLSPDLVEILLVIDPRELPDPHDKAVRDLKDATARMAQAYERSGLDLEDELPANLRALARPAATLV